VNAWPVLAVMLLYPIHQSMGQIGGTMFLASGQTKKYMLVSIAMMLVSIPVSYFILAPANDGWLQGLELGALGMACKMVTLGIVSVNIQAWIIARYGGWKFDWVFQIVGIPMMIAGGFIAKAFSVWIWNFESDEMIGLVVPATITVIIYSCFVIAIIGWLPWLIGADRGVTATLFGRVLLRKI